MNPAEPSTAPAAPHPIPDPTSSSCLRESRQAGKQSLYPLLIQLDMDFLNQASDPCAPPAAGIFPGSRQGVQEPWRFGCAEKLKIINGLLVLIVKRSLCCSRGCSPQIKASCTRSITGRIGGRARMWQELPRNRERAGGASPGQEELLVLCSQRVQPFRECLCSWDGVGMLSSLFWSSTGSLRSGRSALHDCRRCKTARDPDLISAVFYPTK